MTRDEAWRAYQATGPSQDGTRKAAPAHIQEAARKVYDACVAIDERLSPVRGNGGTLSRVIQERARHQPRRGSAWDPEPRRR